MKIAILVFISLFIFSCSKSESISTIEMTIKSSVPIIKARYGFGEGDQYIYYPSNWPQLIGPNNYSYSFPQDSFNEITENHFQREVTLNNSEVGYLGIYTKIDTSSLSAGEKVSFEITITDEQTGEIKYEQKVETTAEYNRELIQL